MDIDITSIQYQGMLNLSIAVIERSVDDYNIALVKHDKESMKSITNFLTKDNLWFDIMSTESNSINDRNKNMGQYILHKLINKKI